MMTNMLLLILLIGTLHLVSSSPLVTDENITSLRHPVEEQGKMLDLQAQKIKLLQEEVQYNKDQLDGNITLLCNTSFLKD